MYITYMDVNNPLTQFSNKPNSIINIYLQGMWDVQGHHQVRIHFHHPHHLCRFVAHTLYLRCKILQSQGDTGIICISASNCKIVKKTVPILGGRRPMYRPATRMYGQHRCIQFPCKVNCPKALLNGNFTYMLIIRRCIQVKYGGMYSTTLS